MQAGSTPQTNDNFQSLNTPETSDLELQLQDLVLQGALTPEQADTIKLEQSSMNNVQTDRDLKKNQMDALLGLQEISDGGGMTMADEANLSKIRNEENTNARGQREAILQNAESRGLGGSGLELMSQMQNQQDSATRGSQRDMDVAAQAQARALEALMQQGNMSGQMQAQDFNQKAQVAQANDAISKFNAQNTQTQTNLNTAARNDAAAKNLGAKQAIADSNVGTRNTQQQYNKNLVQQKYENELKKRSGQSGIAIQNSQAQGANSQAQADANNRTIGTAVTAASMFSDERLKEDVEEFNPADFLDSLTGYKYKYKDPKHGQGKQVGVMAQDLEKTEAGSQLVRNTPEGKVVDYGESGPAVLASLADLNKRLKELGG